MDFDFLSRTPLFKGSTPEETERMLSSLSCRVKEYEKNETIFHSGETISELGIIMEGSIRIEKVDMMGTKNILGIFEKGEIFAESYACVGDQSLMIDVVASEHCSVLFINIAQIFSNRKLAQENTNLLYNLIRIASRKNLKLSMRIFHSSPKTIRLRLFSYFGEQMKTQNSNHIFLPMDRQQLADYLSVDRTALSKELGRLQDEGIIDFHKNEFTINVKDDMEGY